MGFETVADKYWPDTAWHGRSDIHVSVCWGGDIPYKDQDWKTTMAIINANDIGQAIWRSLQKRFDGFVWIITYEEFMNVFLVDCYRHLQGMGDSASSKKLTNPYTGNQFHRIALLDNLVGGIRFWCDPYGDGAGLGFRFRIEAQNEEEDETRRRAREVVMEAQELVEEVMDGFMEIKEPPACKEVQQLLVNLEK